MAEKTIKTKIKLRQETYAYWTDETATAPATKTAGAGTNGYYVPLFGEVCFCEITAANQGTQTTPPTVLFKVGNGTDYFKDLNWASALAADVYSWAKLDWSTFAAKFKAGAEIDVSVANGNITYSHESKLGKSYTTSVPTDKSATAFNDSVTIKVPKLTVNQYGHITAAEDTEYTISIPTPEAASNTVTTLEQGDGITVTDTKTDGNHHYVVSHQDAPTTGTAAGVKTGGTGRTYVTEVLVDERGHIAGVKTATETDQTIPAETAITITDKTGTDTTDEVYAVTNLVEGGTKGHAITPTYTKVATKAYVDKMAAGAVDYLGTLAALTGLSTSARKGDFYRVTTEIKSGSTVLAFVGDIVIAEKDSPAQTIDGTNWTAIHCGDGDISNVAAGNGLTGGGATGSVTLNVGAGNGITVTADAVAAKAGNGISVDANGIHHATPATVAGDVTAANRTYVKAITFDDYGHVTSVSTGTETVTDTHHQAKNIVGTSATATANGAVTGTGGVYLNLVENGAIRSTHKIIGSGAATVKSDSSGNITINATNTWNALSASQDGYVSKNWYTKLNTIATKYTIPNITGEVVLAEQTDITYILDCN